eukprot:TRINITY_DN15723_c0_g1_i3.p1 TRINITY_DN15723_c0_g1~~TRINITY_DN15723_c0_g1_i3.p1  ORF type:complete len:153 (-),score=24.79 TRINITY_DN15723_c0_g1_i3:149-607(-)
MCIRDRFQPLNRKNSISKDSELRNGCCRQCLKAFSSNGKACLCQVPNKVRKAQLPSNGCKICGCNGCNPEDTRGETGNSSRKQSIDKSYRKKSSFDQTGNNIQQDDYNLNNFDKSQIRKILQKSVQIYLPLLGFGIPQRTASYIFGKPSRNQ